MINALTSMDKALLTNCPIHIPHSGRSTKERIPRKQQPPGIAIAGLSKQE
jgi:hypothetical protein